MKRINLLDQNTSNKIAAGEVVERPSSVVKELVENSIDAGAKNITIEIEDGGTSLIRIIDDGHGIYPDDIKKAFLPHATSKIKTSDDIYSINTLGFRGEALPSIASVSKVNIKSRIEEEAFGRELIIEGGLEKSFEDCGINIGTTIEVRDIFFNVPARKKFLKSTSREGALITDIINRTALANPKVSFKLYNNGKKSLYTYGNGNLKDVLRTIYGKTISENVLYFESSDDLVTLYGYIGKEEIARGSRNNQSIFVNGRYIKHKTIVAAVENAFKSFSTVNKFPFFTLFIEVYPEFVDVNIHPTKAEVKFTDDRLMFKKVFDTIHKTLKEDVFNTFSLPEEKDNKTTYVPEQVEEFKFDVKPLTEEKVTFNAFENRERLQVQIPVDLKDHSTFEMEPKKQFDSTEIIKEEIFTNTKKDYDNINDLNTTNDFVSKPSIEESPIINTEYNSAIREDSAHNFSYENPNSNEHSINEENITKDSKQYGPTAKFPPLKIIGQFNKTYILGEYEEVLYMIDQHAAHEKIFFEKYLKSIEEESLIVQPLLVPALIDLTTDDFAYFEENKEVFSKAGFTLEEFGGNTLSLKEVPYFLGKLDPKGLFVSILDNLKDLGSGKTTEVKYNKIATMACKRAVKGNDSLSELEMIKLVEELRFIDDPFHCPHGRPTIIKFTNYDLEKKFRRIV